MSHMASTWVTHTAELHKDEDVWNVLIFLSTFMILKEVCGSLDF